jgi:gliding motility-associated-like protein
MVAAGPGVTATASSTATSCPVAANGTITATATAGLAPFTFQLDAGLPQNGASPFTFNNVPAGAHTVIIRDNAGCNSTITVNVAPGPAVTALAASTATACTGVSNGTITVTPATGTLPFTYSLDGAAAIPGTAPYTFVNVGSGSHTITVTDAAGCVSNVISVVVPVGPGVNGTASAIATSCPGVPNGSVIVTSLTGTAPFTYQLNGGAFQAGASPYTFSNVTAGAHTVVIRDNTGCTQTLNVSVSVGPTLTTTVSKTDALCYGSATGTITVAPPVTGTAPYQYSLDGTTWQASNIFNGLTAGTYTAYYRESNGCQGSQTITVNEPTAIAATANAVAAICNGQNNGSITITASGGSSPYQYSINGGTSWQNNNLFTVAAGSYTISIRDVNNCITTQTVTVTQPPVLSASSVNTAASCNGGNDGVITVTGVGGNAGYQYSLDGVTFQSQNTFNVGPGNYTVTVKDNLGCTTSIAATVTVGSDFTLIPQADATICEGRSVQLQLTSNATQYAWTPATGLSSTTIANPVANPAVTTQYIVTATYGRCSGTDTVIVNVNRAPVPNAGADVTVCSGQTYQLQGSGGTVYSWTPNTYLNNSSISNPVVTPTRSITYTLSIVSDANGCASLVSDQVLVNVNPPITVKTFPYDTIGYTGNQIQLLAVSSDSATNNYSWSPGNGLSSTTIPNPVATVGAVIGDVIRYQVIATNAAGCRGEGYITIRVYKGPDIYVPTGFTPNGDGRNDRLIPVPVGIKNYNYFNVFNRWGQMVFSTKKMHDGWDGKLLLKDQPSGVYVWMIEGVTNDGRVISKQGTVALIR